MFVSHKFSNRIYFCKTYYRSFGFYCVEEKKETPYQTLLDVIGGN